jgi:hypothetical protein
MGTTGEITAKMDGNEVFDTDFITKKTTQFDCDGCGDETINSGHGGGDSGIIFALKELLNGNNVTGVCDISESCFSHMIAFAAEESRLAGGKLIAMDDYLRSHNII